jgi:hypothetical protein
MWTSSAACETGASELHVTITEPSRNTCNQKRVLSPVRRASTRCPTCERRFSSEDAPVSSVSSSESRFRHTRAASDSTPRSYLPGNASSSDLAVDPAYFAGYQPPENSLRVRYFIDWLRAGRRRCRGLSPSLHAVQTGSWTPPTDGSLPTGK